MRTIPSELLDRVKKKWQVPAEYADPAMKVYLSRGFINELFQVFTIQEGAELTDVDVTVKRTDTTAEPAEAFALAINDGVAQVKSKPLPYDDQIPWASVFTVASGVSSVAIEFDGFWDRDYDTRRFNFVTEDHPWFFYVVSGTLYAQYWQDAPITLSTDAVKVCAIRGWLPANGDTSNDQGLIVAYIKTDGLVYYRSYCIQVGGAKLWEVERNVAEVLTTATDFALFRTNDFRIGFVVNLAGTLYWLLTERNYAGMSVWPEQITAGIADVSFSVLPVTYYDAFEPTEHITSQVNVERFYVCPYNSTVSVSAIERLQLADQRTIKLTFNVPMEMNYAALMENLKVRNSVSQYYTVADIAIAGNVVTITSVVDMPFTQTIYVEMSQANLYYLAGRITPTCLWDFSSFSIECLGLPPNGYETENVTTAISNVSFIVTQVYYRSAFSDVEQITAGISNVSFVVTKVGGNPL